MLRCANLMASSSSLFFKWCGRYFPSWVVESISKNLTTSILLTLLSLPLVWPSLFWAFRFCRQPADRLTMARECQSSILVRPSSRHRPSSQLIRRRLITFTLLLTLMFMLAMIVPFHATRTLAASPIHPTLHLYTPCDTCCSLARAHLHFNINSLRIFTCNNNTSNPLCTPSLPLAPLPTVTIIKLRTFLASMLTLPLLLIPRNLHHRRRHATRLLSIQSTANTANAISWLEPRYMGHLTLVSCSALRTV